MELSLLLQVRQVMSTNCSFSCALSSHEQGGRCCRRRKISELFSIQRLKAHYETPSWALLTSVEMLVLQGEGHHWFRLCPWVLSSLHSYTAQEESGILRFPPLVAVSQVWCRQNFLSALLKLPCVFFFGCLPSHFQFFLVTHPQKKITLIFNCGAYLYAYSSTKRKITWHVACLSDGDYGTEEGIISCYQFLWSEDDQGMTCI